MRVAMYLCSAVDPARLQNLWWAVLTSISILIAGAVAKSLIALSKSKIETDRKRREAIDAILPITPLLVKIAAEFRPNGGSTFRDKLDKAVDLSQQQLEHGKQVDARLTEVEKQLGAVRGHSHAQKENLEVLRQAERQIVEKVEHVDQVMAEVASAVRPKENG